MRIVQFMQTLTVLTAGVIIAGMLASIVLAAIRKH